MRRLWIAAWVVVFLGLAGAAYAECTTNTYFINGRIGVCTTCCSGGFCHTTCS